MTTDLDRTFQAFMRRREDAARAYVRGDPAPLDGLVAREAPASFFGPTGSVVRGTSEAVERYRQDAKLFGTEGDTRFEVFESAAGGDIAYWTGLQHAEVRIGEDAIPRQMVLRVTEVFVREGGEWRLVHRHADSLASG